VCTKSVLRTHRVGPLTAIAVRSSVDMPLLWGACLLAMLVLRLKQEPSDWMHAGNATLLKLFLGSGLTAGGLGMIFFYSALSLGEVSVIKPIAFTIAPATGVLLGWLLLGEEMTARKWAAVAIIIFGVILLTGGGARAAPDAGSPGASSAGGP
jgi:uncharacterized membrane protein